MIEKNVLDIVKNKSMFKKVYWEWLVYFVFENSYIGMDIRVESRAGFDPHSYLPQQNSP